ncbi:DUF2269 family protein [Salinarimonas ramus]|uniref:DUF2269 family protein n=1 Tax=Salinarimonas ramus TaxID=690164 RepID=A0A917Q3M0_9HYPH|nr:DUF2269 family protein [Salinarimonas ramus]GGK18202.1 hypothetical protein GCM10011322_01150 [Salinarimonas ramus]
MRKLVKILHSVAAAGLIGGLACYMVLLVAVPVEDAAAYAGLRAAISALSSWVLLPSLAVGLVSGLLSMIVHRPFQEMGWVWIKAGLGILMFKGTLTIVSAKADAAAAIAQRIAAGAAGPEALDELLVLEWGTLAVVMAIAVANVVLGIWRPRLVRIPERPRETSRAPS